MEEVVFGSKVAAEGAATAKPAVEGKPAASPDLGRSGGSSGNVAVGRLKVRPRCVFRWRAR